MKVALLVLVLVGVALVSGTVLYSDNIGKDYESRWVVSKVKEADGTLGKWERTAGKNFNDADKDAGIKTTEDARFYQISSKFPKFTNTNDKPLVIQYTVKYEESVDCGGAYIKLLPPGLDQTKFEGESPYNIMFGPDVCGSTKRVHAILNYKGQNHLIKRTVYPETDTGVTHAYTFVINPDQTYEILIDGQSKQSGTIADDWDILPPRTIKDPSVSKPSDWVDQAKIDDPSAVKPDGWDAITKDIVDPTAQKPEDWDDELDGEWEAPQIPNPEYKGEWKAPSIENPAYKGEWVHPEIANPEFTEDPNLTVYEHEFLGIEIWQVKSGSILGHFLVTDNVAEAQAYVDGDLKALQETERAAKETADKAAKEAAEKEAAERAASQKDDAYAEASADADDDDHDDDDKGHDEL